MLVKKCWSMLVRYQLSWSIFSWCESVTEQTQYNVGNTLKPFWLNEEGPFDCWTGGIWVTVGGGVDSVGTAGGAGVESEGTSGGAGVDMKGTIGGAGADSEGSTGAWGDWPNDGNELAPSMGRTGGTGASVAGTTIKYMYQSYCKWFLVDWESQITMSQSP